MALSVGAVAGCGAAAPEAHVVAPLGDPTPQLTSGVKSFRSVEFGRVVVGADPIESGQAAGHWHSEIVLEDGRAVRVEDVGPSGLPDESTSITYGADGAQTRVHSNAYGVTTYTDHLTPDGDRTRVERSGAVNERGCARIHETYDVHDLVQSATCLDVDGRIVTNADGCAIRRYEYDDHLRRHRGRCFAEDGTPTPFRFGWQTFLIDYDARGYRTRITRLNGDATGAGDDYGCAGTLYDNDRAGNTILSTCLDEEGRAREKSGTNVASTRTQYDRNGCTIEEDTLDAAGKLVSVLGVARRVFTRDPHCGVLSIVQLDANGQRVAPPSAVSSFDFVRNADGLVVEERCRDAKGGPTSCLFATGVEGALVRLAYDGHGREMMRRGFTEAGHPSNVGSGYPHEWRYVYSEDGVSYGVSYFDEQGHPALANGTVATHAYSYDRLGALASAKSLDANGNLVLPSTGCADTRRIYDASHRLSALECRGTDGALAAASLAVNAIRWPSKSARVVVDRTGNVVTGNSYFGTDGRLIKHVECGPEPCFR